VALFAGLQSAGVLGLTLPLAAQWTGVVIVSIAIVYFGAIITFGGLAPEEKKRVGAVFVFFVASALFWAGFEQAGSSLNLFGERLTRRVFFGWEMPTSWLQSVQPFFVIALAPLFGVLWSWLSSREKEPSTPAKFAYGLILLGLGFAVLAWGATYTDGGNRVSVNWLLTTYFLHTVGELCLSPVGLSVVTKLSPQKLVGQMMGIWFMGTALGNLIAGLAAGFMETLPVSQLFGAVFLFTAGAGLVLALFAGPLRRLMSGIH
jgi:POT family proton-dependent oligopeptide transporter